MSDNNHVLWGCIKKSVIKVCDELCVHNEKRKCNVNMCWGNSGVKDQIQMKKEAYEEMKTNSAEE